MRSKNIVLLKINRMRSKNLSYFLIVFVFFLFYFSPFFVLGKNVFINSHDNLDSINMLGIFDGEFKGSLLPSDKAPNYALPSVDQKFMVRDISIEKLLFYLFGFFNGYVLNEIIIRLVAFLGMFYLVKIIQGAKPFPEIFQILIAISFASIPFRTLASLTIPGLPMLAVSFINLYSSTNKLRSYTYIIIFGFYSSFVLVGFFVGLIIITTFIYLLLNKKLNKWVFGAAGLLLLSYLISHYNLFLNMLFQDLETNRSIRSALYLAKNTNAFEQFLSILYNNHYHATTNHGLIIFPSIYVLLFENFRKSKQKKLIVILLSFILLSAVLVGLSFYTNFIKIIGPTGGFTWNRFYFINPLIWYTLWAIVLIETYNSYKVNTKFLFSMLFVSFIYGIKVFPNTLLIFFITILIIGFYINQKFQFSIKKNSLFLSLLLIMQILLNTYNYTYVAYTAKPSFKDFFSRTQFDDIINTLQLDKNNIRVGCIGFFPSVANFNGIKTLGAYENIYPMEFKNKFYKIIKDEITKNDYLYNYFTKWGNRAYLFDNEIGKTYYDQQFKIKKHFPEITCDLNTSLMKELGTTHIFSTSKIKNNQEKNLDLLYTSNNPDFFYRMYVYKLN